MKVRIPNFGPVVAELERIYDGMTKPAPVVVEPPPPPPPQPAPKTVYIQASQVEEDPLPPFMRKLPERFQTQEWFIGIVATGVLGGMLFLYFILRLISRLVF